MPRFAWERRAGAARAVAVACLLLFFALGLRAVRTMSPTNDEPAHLLRGYVLRTSGSLQYQTGHAPLSHRLIGFLLTGDDSAPDLAALPSWPNGERLQIAADLLWRSGVDVDRFLFLARVPILWMGIILGGLIGSWALTWHGRGAQAVALILFATAPNLLASAALATTDFVTVVTYFGTVYAWWRYWRNGRRRWWLLTALFLGLALATKLTAVLLLPALFLLTLLFLGRGRPWWQPFAAWLALLPAAALVLWLVYGLQIDSVPGWPWPLPAAAYITSWQTVLDHVQRGHQAFLMGDLSGEGWWYYFPLTYALKTPLVTIALLLTGLVVIAGTRALWPTAIFLLLPVGALFAAAMTSRLNIGYRHILPVTPFALVLASSAVLLLRRWAVSRALLVLALAWMVIAALRQQPHFLAYFNELAGGSAEGYRYLGDSNVDWGQDLKLLAEEIKQTGGPWIVSYAGAGDPSYYGISSDRLVNHDGGELPFAPANPQPGRYAISANHWQGILPDADTFDWFRHQEVQRNLGGSILIYDVAQHADGAWIAHCLDPAPARTAAEAEALVGRSGLRHLWFDCRQSWVLPGGQKAGWYITPQGAAAWPAALLAEETALRPRLVYRHRASADAPSFDVYYWPGGGLAPDSAATQRSAQTATGQVVDLPFATSAWASLNGYQRQDGDWITFWELTGRPEEPVSLRAHLYAADGAPPLVADGLGFSGDQWQVGDLLWQRHSFATPDAAYLETGLYNFESLATLGELLRLPAD